MGRREQPKGINHERKEFLIIDEGFGKSIEKQECASVKWVHVMWKNEQLLFLKKNQIPGQQLQYTGPLNNLLSSRNRLGSFLEKNSQSHSSIFLRHLWWSQQSVILKTPPKCSLIWKLPSKGKGLRYSFKVERGQCFFFFKEFSSFLSTLQR